MHLFIGQSRLSSVFYCNNSFLVTMREIMHNSLVSRDCCVNMNDERKDWKRAFKILFQRPGTGLKGLPSKRLQKTFEQLLKTKSKGWSLLPPYVRHCSQRGTLRLQRNNFQEKVENNKLGVLTLDSKGKTQNNEILDNIAMEVKECAICRGSQGSRGNKCCLLQGNFYGSQGCQGSQGSQGRD